MALERAQALIGLFPRWKTTPELLKFAEELLGAHPLAEVQAAARTHRLNRGKADDPDLKDVEAWLRNRKCEVVREQKQQAAAPAPDVWTEEDRQWCAMMDCWRADYRDAKPANALKWVSDAFGAAARDLAKFGITHPDQTRRFLRKIARDCGGNVGGSDIEAVKGAA